jgi:hypothetical protein
MGGDVNKARRRPPIVAPILVAAAFEIRKCHRNPFMQVSPNPWLSAIYKIV